MIPIYLDSNEFFNIFKSRNIVKYKHLKYGEQTTVPISEWVKELDTVYILEFSDTDYYVYLLGDGEYLRTYLINSKTIDAHLPNFKMERLL